MPAFAALRFPFGTLITGIGALVAEDQHHAMTTHAAGAAGTAGFFERLAFCQPGAGAVVKYGGQGAVFILRKLGDIAVIQLFLAAFYESGVA